jgi:hypothetical protein
MKTAADEYKAAVSNAIAFKREHPDEKATTAARIHCVNAITIRSNLRSVAFGSEQQILVKMWFQLLFLNLILAVLLSTTTIDTLSL